MWIDQVFGGGTEDGYVLPMRLQDSYQQSKDTNTAENKEGGGGYRGGEEV